MPGAGGQRRAALVILSQTGTVTWDLGAFVPVAGSDTFVSVRAFWWPVTEKHNSVFKEVSWLTEWSRGWWAARVGWSRS